MKSITQYGKNQRISIKIVSSFTKCSLFWNSILHNEQLLILFQFFIVTLDEVLLNSDNFPKICWEYNRNDDQFPLHFDGIPYIWLGRRKYQCHQGKDKAVHQKEKYRTQKNSKLLSEHGSAASKTRKHTQPTKKLGCPVTFEVKKLFRFPEARILNDTKWNRSLASKSIKKKLLDIQSGAHTTFGHLEYVTSFPAEGKFDLTNTPPIINSFSYCDLLLIFL